ncbi:peptidoglycan-binding protein [Lacticaseibacillus absianus]|uniref:peptidoglycan-binding protein n=1 Tax=Lacticaseibacillus absianus TaxID=2729623 RepID=UPI001C53A2BF|nr:peptidoglycan-binding protein [Lacticaseibacillus absianus]
MTAAAQVLDEARKYLGVRGGSSGHANILATYNGHKPLAQGYKVKAGDNWCDTFVSFIFIRLGATALIGGTECGVERHTKLFAAEGIWLEDGTITPKVGDIIVYNWDDTTQPNNGFADHIGFVETVSGRTITTIEGNKGNRVARRTLSVGAGQIRGYARPKYSGAASTPAPAGKPVAPAKVTGNAAIKTVQAWLNATYGTGLAVDGFGGPATKRALIVGLQTELNRQANAGLHVDGYWGPKTAAAVIIVNPGARGNLTRLIQGALICHGYDPKGFDGDFGSGCRTALTSFQKAHGLSADGGFGRATAPKLFA